MTITSTVQILEDGPRNLVVRLSATIPAGNAENFVEKVEVTTLSNWQSRACNKLSLLELRSSTVNASFTLWWEALLPANNLRVWGFPMNLSDHQKFRKFGGIQNNATGGTGCVLLSTENWGDPQFDGSYDITLWFRKKYPA
jgi:hypothetical protein